jgi:hypothetical protein
MQKSKEKYIVELGKVFVYEPERNAYLFAGNLLGRSLKEWIKDQELQEYEEDPEYY